MTMTARDDEPARLLAIDRFRLGDIGREPAFEELATIAARMAGAPIGLVTIVGQDVQCFAGASGLDVTRGRREDAICAFTIRRDEPLTIPDMLLDERFRRNPYVIGPPFVRSYAGVPVSVDGQRVGTLCLVDTVPRTFPPEAIDILRRLASLGGTLIESRLDRVLSAESEQRLRAFVEAMPVALSVYDREERLVTANAGYRETFFGDRGFALTPGLTFPEVLDRIEAHGVRIAIDGDERNWKERRIALRRRGGDPYEMQLSTGIWLACHEIRTDDGGLIAAFTDITTVKDREAALAEQSTLLRTTLESIDQGIAVFNRDEGLISCSDAYFELLKIPEPLRAFGTPLSAIVHDLARRGYLGEGDPDEIHAKVIASVAAQRGRRSEIRTPDGRVLAISRSVSEDGRIIITCLDVTERREIERLKDEFVSTVSHELRTPLTALTGSLGLLTGGAAGALSSQAARLLEIAHKNVQRLTRLVNDLLDIDKIEAGQIEFKRDLVDLNAVVEQAVEHNRPYADRFGVRLEAQPAPRPVTIRGDADRLLQVATNLVSNAVKHSPTGGTVTISALAEGRAGRLAVVDRGAGIPESFQARIFRRFAQADGSDRRAREGTGLGLAISRAIVERHSGAIGFETEQGVGTTFYVDLPLADAGVTAKPSARALICEDDAAFAALITRILGGGGVAVEVVGTCAEALERLRATRYDVAIIDLRLPDGNGLDLIRTMREGAGTRDIPVLVVSAFADEARRSLETGALGVLDWIQKPVDGPRLVRAVAQARGTASSERLRVLHVEDEDDLREVVALALSSFADVDVAIDVAGARGLLRERSYDAVIIDIALPDGSGAGLLPDIASRPGAPMPVIIFSAEEPSEEVLARVHRALVKSRTSVDDLAEVVRQFTIVPSRTGSP